MSFIPSPLALMRTGIIRDESCEIATANGLHPLPLLNYPCSCFIKNAPRFARRSSLDFQSRKNLLLVAHDARVRHWLRHERVPPITTSSTTTPSSVKTETCIPTARPTATLPSTACTSITPTIWLLHVTSTPQWVPPPLNTSIRSPRHLRSSSPRVPRG